jgi:UDP-glucose 4-epimerase
MNNPQESSAQERCLVLGGGGFIGQHLCEALLMSGYRVRIFERPRLTKHDLYSKLEWLEGDFTNEIDVSEAVKDCQWVFHLISTTLPKTSNDNPLYDLESNVASTLRLLELLLESSSVKKLIYISSGGTVYGVPQTIPIPENHATNPTSAYGISKLAIEKYLELYRLLHHLNYAVVRLANPYGEYQRVHSAQGAVPVFMHKALRDEPIEIWGDGTVVRDYIYIADVVRALLKMMPYEGEQRVFNIGGGQGTSLLELIKLLEELLERPVRHRFLAGRAFDVPVNVLDITKARQELDWEPQMSLLSGMRQVLSYMRKHYL